MAKPDVYLDDDGATVTRQLLVKDSKDGDPKVQITPGGAGVTETRIELGGVSTESDQDSVRREGADDQDWDIQLRADEATINVGGGAGNDSGGEVRLYGHQGRGLVDPRVHMKAEGTKEFDRTNVFIGGGGNDDEVGHIEVGDKISIRADGGEGEPPHIQVGDDNDGGVISTYDTSGNGNRGAVLTETLNADTIGLGGFLFPSISLSGDDSDIFVGGNDAGGTVTVRDANGRTVATIEPTTSAQGNHAGKVTLNGPNGNTAGVVEGGNGKLLLKGANGTVGLEIDSNGDVNVKGGSVGST